jgi:hypothetical protein
MERLAGDKCCLLASLMLLLWSLLLGVKGASIFTHHCVINIDAEVQVSHASASMQLIAQISLQHSLADQSACRGILGPLLSKQQNKQQSPLTIS